MEAHILIQQSQLMSVEGSGVCRDVGIGGGEEGDDPREELPRVAPEKAN